MLWRRRRREAEEETVEKDVPECVDESGDDLRENEVDETWIEVQWMFSIYQSHENKCQKGRREKKGNKLGFDEKPKFRVPLKDSEK